MTGRKLKISEVELCKRYVRGCKLLLDTAASNGVVLQFETGDKAYTKELCASPTRRLPAPQHTLTPPAQARQRRRRTQRLGVICMSHRGLPQPRRHQGAVEVAGGHHVPPRAE